MGMAASQARLLTITARMHDVEYQAQSIQNAKIALSTQEDAVHKKYLEALDATTMTVKDWQGNIITANFNTLCGISAADVGNYRYALFDSKGGLIVDDEIAEEYASYLEEASDPSAEGFAIYMLTGGECTSINFDDDGKFDIDDYREGYTGVDQKAIEEARGKIDSLGPDVYSTYTASNFDELCTYALEDDMPPGTDENLWEDVKKAVNAYQNLINQANYKVFKTDAEKIFEQAGYKEEFNQSDFTYYVNMYKQIEANKGHVTAISKFNGIDGIGHAATDSDWLQNMVQSGKITIDRATIDNKGYLSFASTAVSSDSKLEYTTTSTIDKTALAKAEAEYEHNMKQINAKDKKFDMDLSKLEAERTALKTEYDSVKKVVSDNIERTFGIFS